MIGDCHLHHVDYINCLDDDEILHFLVIKGDDLKDRLSYLEEELLFKLEVFNHTSQTFLSTSPPCTTQGAEQRARVGDGPHQDGH